MQQFAARLQGGHLIQKLVHRASRTSGRLSFLPDVEWQLALFLCVAVIVGGGGTYTGIANLLVQLCSLALLAMNLPLAVRFWSKAHWTLRALVCATLALPLVQIVPLPPAVWSGLPGRSPLVQSYALLDVALPWRAMSVTPTRSFLAFLSLIAPLTVLVLCTALDGRQREKVLIVVVALGVFEFALGVMQVLSQNRVGNLFGGYGYVVPSQLYGTFANHNATGLFFVLSLCALTGLPLWRRSMNGVMIHAAVALVLALGAVLTQSRSSMLVLVVPALLGFWRVCREAAFAARFFGQSWWKRILAGLVLAALLGASLAWLSQVSRVSSSISRFEESGNARPGVWRDTRVAITEFWPVGSGIGTFADVFQLSESLENVSEFRVNRAHNEYLEVVLESGAVGGLLVAAWVVWILVVALSGRRIRSRGRLAALGGLLCVALQSAVDYPLRTEAIFSISAFFLSLLMVPHRPSASSSENVVD